MSGTPLVDRADARVEGVVRAREAGVGRKAGAPRVRRGPPMCPDSPGPPDAPPPPELVPVVARLRVPARAAVGGEVVRVAAPGARRVEPVSAAAPREPSLRWAPAVEVAPVSRPPASHAPDATRVSRRGWRRCVGSAAATSRRAMAEGGQRIGRG